MTELRELFENNRAWADARRAADPEFFARLAEGQSPSYLWIGCADSRVPAEDIVGLNAGELFVHRNVANVVEPSDINCLSVLQFAVGVLKVRHIIVCGHYGCGGVQAAMGDAPLGIIDAWLARIREVIRLHREELDGLSSGEARFRRLCELNVLEQAVSACYAPSVREAWQAGQDLTVHGLIYGLEDGLLRDLGFSVSGREDVERVYGRALASP
jgi:carbonic anhydrase